MWNEEQRRTICLLCHCFWESAPPWNLPEDRDNYRPPPPGWPGVGLALAEKCPILNSLQTFTATTQIFTSRDPMHLVSAICGL